MCSGHVHAPTHACHFDHSRARGHCSDRQPCSLDLPARRAAARAFHRNLSQARSTAVDHASSFRRSSRLSCGPLPTGDRLQACCAPSSRQPGTLAMHSYRRSRCLHCNDEKQGWVRCCITACISLRCGYHHTRRSRPVTRPCHGCVYTVKRGVPGDNTLVTAVTVRIFYTECSNLQGQPQPGACAATPLCPFTRALHTCSGSAGQQPRPHRGRGGRG